uniref:Uncharacterized protein n=1 Tax=Lotharella globosa TaxID=91324 RepID=A0A6V3TQJ4_9EUKA|mmetsp:Transcript_16235/g.32899  ORF Transcript_16235/g.32899 Transcript_16235/m.32899 type:complete len:113 (-) Transcript_16235:91-429(-)
MSVPFGKIASIDEIQSAKKYGENYRVTGQLIKYNASSNICTISSVDCKGELTINIDLIANFPFKLGSLFQFIGEWRLDGCLHARIARNVDGLDMKLYAAAVKLCREHGRIPI